MKIIALRKQKILLFQRDSALMSMRKQAVNRPNVTNKASTYPFMLSNHQLSSQGPEESGTKVGKSM